MKRLTLCIALVALVAYAGTRSIETSGTLPAASTDGVSLAEMTACRASVRFTDGGSVAGGKMIPYYYDSTNGWLEGPKTAQCSLDTDTQIDGGARRSQVCEWTVSAQYGRAAVVPSGLTPQSVGTIRLECSGPNVPGGSP